MKLILLLTLPLVPLGSVWLQESAGPPQEQPDSKHLAAELYADRCAACHLPPDPAFAVDRAWLGQLMDTA